MEGFLGIAGYEPDWLSDPVSFCDRHVAALGALLAGKLVSTWVLWDTTHDEHFAEAPVILQFDRGPQIEVCCWKLDEMSLTYDRIDVSDPPDWGWEPRAFEWRRDALRPLASVLGAQLQTVGLIEIEFTAARSAWCLGGLEFGFEEASLGIYNGLDDTQVALDLDPGPGWRKRSWLPT